MRILEAGEPRDSPAHRNIVSGCTYLKASKERAGSLSHKEHVDDVGADLACSARSRGCLAPFGYLLSARSCPGKVIQKEDGRASADPEKATCRRRNAAIAVDNSFSPILHRKVQTGRDISSQAQSQSQAMLLALVFGRDAGRGTPRGSSDPGRLLQAAFDLSRWLDLYSRQAWISRDGTRAPGRCGRDSYPWSRGTCPGRNTSPFTGGPDRDWDWIASTGRSH